MTRDLGLIRADLRRLGGLLGQEQAALRAVDLGALERVASRIAPVLNRLDRYQTGQHADLAPLVDQVRADAMRNRRLYEAVLSGLREARAVIEGARNPPPGKTYDRKGCRTPLAPRGGTLERRA